MQGRFSILKGRPHAPQTAPSIKSRIILQPDWFVYGTYVTPGIGENVIYGVRRFA